MALHKLDVVAHTWNLSNLEVVETGGSEIQDHPLQYNEL